jgi:two-component system KDP operon response regulator KdpE
MRARRILICCEVNADIRDEVTNALSEEGYAVAVAADADEAKKLLLDWSPDLVVLDVGVPGSKKAGWRLLRDIRAHGTGFAIVVMTTLSRVDDRVRALNLGADDYISKPFHIEEVKARIRAVLRRMPSYSTTPSIAIDDHRKEVRAGERSVTLSPKEYGLLKLLASSPGRVFSCDEILARLWPGRSYATGEDVQKYVYLLRRKIEDDPKDPKIVLTVRGFGYRLAA